ncbi:hypothetical protein [Actinobaculum sp. 352]|uniref:hypothetical protein n=1 Tax=Actinobaculum sp. 352 TaxID=2490946 RepID=UPI000FA77A61|nr:hypothetical protein [Actinobaculum sp. 352]RTE50214.1 hypothetical protein EKN07_03105 [Actinobaculum sp. 352]
MSMSLPSFLLGDCCLSSGICGMHGYDYCAHDDGVAEPRIHLETTGVERYRKPGVTAVDPH